MTLTCPVCDSPTSELALCRQCSTNLAPLARVSQLPEEYMRHGLQLFEAGDMDAAIECFAASISLNPTFDAHFGMARAYAAKAMDSSALRHCSRAAQLRPARPEPALLRLEVEERRSKSDSVAAQANRQNIKLRRLVWLLPVVAFAAGLVTIAILPRPRGLPPAENNAARIHRRLNSLTATRGLNVGVTEHDNRVFIRGLVPDEARLILVREVASEDAGGNVDFGDLKMTPAPPPITYTVRRGDSLWRIAKRKYGDGAFWPDIVKANPQRKSSAPVYVGDSLILPPLIIQPH